MNAGNAQGAMTEEEIATIAAKHRLAKFPNLALTRERLSRKAKAEPKFRFYTLYGRVVDEETIRCAWKRVWKKDKVRYADDFVLLAKRWKDGFLRKVEGMLEERMGLTVNREKTKVLDLDAERSSLVFLGYEFRKVRDGLFGTGRRYLHFGPSSKSVKRVCREVHELTHSRNVLLPVETVVERVNRLLKGWGAFYSVGYPSRVFRKVNHYVLKRMARLLNRKSQRYCRLKFADTYYGEMTHYGLYRLA